MKKTCNTSLYLEKYYKKVVNKLIQYYCFGRRVLRNDNWINSKNARPKGNIHAKAAYWDNFTVSLIMPIRRKRKHFHDIIINAINEPMPAINPSKPSLFLELFKLFNSPSTTSWMLFYFKK